jgi:hypothetical protein
MMKKPLSIKTHVCIGEEFKLNINDKVQVAYHLQLNLVLHLLIAGAEERQGAIIDSMNLIHYSSGCTKL